MLLRWPFVAALLTAVWPASHRVCAEEELVAAPAASNRLIHSFDFNERPLGNLESVPMHWIPFRGAGFPFFAEGAFDETVGHDAPPSFRLSSSGRNVCFLYQGPQTRVRPNSTYRIAGFVKSEGLDHARAMVAACFLDERGDPMLDAFIRSQPIGGGGEAEWVELSLDLPTAPPRARTVGLFAMVLQRETWDLSPRRPGEVEFKDVNGVAWFDDLRVLAVPLIDMSASTPTHVFTENDGEGIDLRITAADPSGLHFEVVVRDVEGRTVHQESNPVTDDPAGTVKRLRPAGLAPGLYRAEMTVYEGGQPLARRRLTFVTLGAPRSATRAAGARPFGLVIQPDQRPAPDVETQLLLKQGVRSAKLPLWSGRLPAPTAPAYTRRQADHALMTLYRAGFHITGLFVGPPEEVLRAAGAYRPKLLETLNSDPAAWSASVADAVASNATMIADWQVGEDNDIQLVADERLVEGRRQMCEQLTRFIHEPRMITPASAAIQPRVEASQNSDLCLSLGREIRPDQIAEHVERFRKGAVGRLDAFLEAADDQRYDRCARLADWAQRVVLARHAGVSTVYLPQTWRIDASDGQGLVEPLEEFVLLNTLAGVLDDARPGSMAKLGDSAQAAVFIRGEEAVVALWDPAAPPEGREHELQLDGVLEVVDLWGNRIELSSSQDGRQLVRLTPMPVLAPGASMWVFEFQEKADLTPANLPFSVEPQTCTLSLTNPTTRPIGGEAVLDLPPSWEGRPSKLRFELPAGSTVTYPVEVRYPSGEPAGGKPVRLRMTVDGTPPRSFEKEFTLDLGLADVDVFATAYRDHATLVIRQTIRNRSNGMLSFRGGLGAPGRSRQYRHILDIPPGASRIEEYTLPDAADLTGKTLRLGLREIDGDRIHNLELVAP